MERFKRFTTMVNRQTKPCSATTVNNIDDDIIVNLSDVSVVDLDYIHIHIHIHIHIILGFMTNKILQF